MTDKRFSDEEITTFYLSVGLGRDREILDHLIEKGKQAGQEEALGHVCICGSYEDGYKAKVDAVQNKEILIQKEKIAALEKEIEGLKKSPATLPANYTNYQAMVKENARLRDALLFGIGMNVSAGFSSSIDEKEYAQVEKHIWNEFFRKAKKALEAKE